MVTHLPNFTLRVICAVSKEERREKTKTNLYRIESFAFLFCFFHLLEETKF